MPVASLLLNRIAFSKDGGQLSEIGCAAPSQRLFRLAPPTKVSTTWLVGQGGILFAVMAAEAFPAFLSSEAVADNIYYYGVTAPGELDLTLQLEIVYTVQ